MSDDKRPCAVVAAIQQAFISPNELDANFEAANITDGLFAVARAISEHFRARDTNEKGKRPCLTNRNPRHKTHRKHRRHRRHQTPATARSARLMS